MTVKRRRWSLKDGQMAGVDVCKVKKQTKKKTLIKSINGVWICLEVYSQFANQPDASCHVLRWTCRYKRVQAGEAICSHEGRKQQCPRAVQNYCAWCKKVLSVQQGFYWNEKKNSFTYLSALVLTGDGIFHIVRNCSL